MVAIVPSCPKCGKLAISMASKFGVKHICCDLESYNGKPLTTRKVLAARMAAHQAFDQLWEGGLVRRSYAYRLLADELGIPGSECHIGRMQLDMLERIPAAVLRIHDKLLEKPRRRAEEVERAKEQRRKLSQSLPKCKCGNILSRARQLQGIAHCPAHDRNEFECS